MAVDLNASNVVHFAGVRMTRSLLPHEELFGSGKVIGSARLAMLTISRRELHAADATRRRMKLHALSPLLRPERITLRDQVTGIAQAAVMFVFLSFTLFEPPHLPLSPPPLFFSPFVCM
jgi:hypothetical protein